MADLFYLDQLIAHEDMLERAERLLLSEADRLRRFVSEVVTEPICAIAFLYTESDEPLFSYAYAWTAAAREAMRDSLSRRPDPVWAPADWDIDLDLAQPDSDTIAEAEQVGNAIEGELRTARRLARDEPRTSNVARPFLLDLSAYLNKMDWSGVAPVTEDFVVWANEVEDIDLTQEVFRSIAPAAAFAAYEQRGWLGWLDEHAWQ